MKKFIVKALNKQAVNPVAQEVYGILVQYYSTRKCVMQVLGDLNIWSSRRRGDWKPDLLHHLNKIASDMTPAGGPAPFYATLMATLMAEGHNWFQLHAPDCFKEPTLASDTTPTAPSFKSFYGLQ